MKRNKSRVRMSVCESDAEAINNTGTDNSERKGEMEGWREGGINEIEHHQSNPIDTSTSKHAHT